MLITWKVCSYPNMFEKSGYAWLGAKGPVVYRILRIPNLQSMTTTISMNTTPLFADPTPLKGKKCVGAQRQW